jgi:hypothetical protein
MFLVKELAQARDTPNRPPPKMLYVHCRRRTFKTHSFFREIALPQHMQIKWDWNILYSRGQAKPTNLIYRSGVHLAVRFFQILTQIVEMNQKTHLRSFSHDVLGMARILDQKSNIWSKKQVEISQKSSEVVPVLGFGWKLIRKGKECIKKGFPCISEA